MLIKDNVHSYHLVQVVGSYFPLNLFYKHYLLQDKLKRANILYYTLDTPIVLAHLSLKLKWAFLITYHLSICLSVFKLFTFFTSTEPLGQFQPSLAKRGFDEWSHPFPRGDNWESYHG